MTVLATPLSDTSTVRTWLVDKLGTPQQDRGDHDLNPTLGIRDDLRPAAVLVPLVARSDGATILLTRRTDHLDNHPGQVSFPGGHIDAGDATPEDAALREAEEEIGLHRRFVDIVGRLDRYVTRTGFDVTPVVGLVTPGFDITPDPFEVADVFEVPLAFLMDPANHRRDSHTLEGVERFFHAMPYGNHYIWGATAGMLVDLYEKLGADDL